MKIKRLLEFKDDFLVFCKIFVPRSEGPPLSTNTYMYIFSYFRKRDQYITKALENQVEVQVPEPKTNKSTEVPLGDPFKNISDPCLQSGLQTQALDPDYHDKVTFKGTGDYDKCKDILFPLLNLTVTCVSLPCSMNGVHQPTISYSKDSFYGFSEFWYTMEDVFRIGGKYDHEEFDIKARVSFIPHSHTVTPFDAPWKQAF